MQSQLQTTIDRVAATDLSAKRYHLVMASGGGGIDQCVAADVNTGLGVLQNDPVADAHANVAVSGPSKVVAGGSLAADTLFTTTASGRATAAASGDLVFGRTLNEAAGADGDIINVLLQSPTRLPL